MLRLSLPTHDSVRFLIVCDILELSLVKLKTLSGSSGTSAHHGCSEVLSISSTARSMYSYRSCRISCRAVPGGASSAASFTESRMESPTL